MQPKRRTLSAIIALFAVLLAVEIPSTNPASAQTQFPVARNLVSLAWTGQFFVASYRYSTDVTRLLNVSYDGRTVQPFAPSFTWQGEAYVALSLGEAGFPLGYLFVSSGSAVYELKPDGKNATLFAKPADSTIEYIAFDSTGMWGHRLFVLYADGTVWAVDSHGSAALLARLGAGLVPEGIAVAPPSFGNFGGDLLVSMEANHKVIALSRTNTAINTTLAVFPGEAPERVLEIPAGEDLYVAKYSEGTVIRFAASNLSAYAGSMLVITEGENGQAGSLTVLSAEGISVSATTIYKDTTSPHFEGAVFVKSSLAPTTTATVGGGAAEGGVQTSAVVVLVAVSALVIVLLVRRLNKK